MRRLQHFNFDVQCCIQSAFTYLYFGSHSKPFRRFTLEAVSQNKTKGCKQSTSSNEPPATHEATHEPTNIALQEIETSERWSTSLMSQSVALTLLPPELYPVALALSRRGQQTLFLALPSCVKGFGHAFIDEFEHEDGIRTVLGFAFTLQVATRSLLR